MSHSAAIAERHGTDRYTIYHSRNGADQIHLLDELRDSLTVHGGIDWESLTGRTQPAAMRQMSPPPGGRDDVTTPGNRHVVNPHPIVRDVPQEQVLAAAGHLAYEVLYVVDEGTVDAYWLTWTYPDVIRPWAEHLEVDVYERESSEDLVESTNRIKDEEPLRTIGDFEAGWLDDEVTREVVQTAHRWVYEMQAVGFEQMETAGEDGADAIWSLATPEYQLRVRTEASDPLVQQSHPYIVPVRLGETPTADSIQISELAQQIRFEIGAELQAADRVSQAAITRARTDTLIAIVDQYLTRVEPAFVPGELGDIIATCQKTSK